MRFFLRKKHTPQVEQLTLADAFLQQGFRGNILSESKRKSPLFRIYSSVIKQNSFTLKVSYEKRSFLISGTYRLEKIQSYVDDSCESRAVGIKIENISMFEDSHYILASLSKTQTSLFIKESEVVLNDIAFNPYLQIEE